MSERDRDSLNSAERDYDRKFGGNFNPGAGRDDRDSIDKSREGLQQGERSEGADNKKAIADTAAGKAAMAAGAAAGPAGRIATKILGRIRTKEGGIGAIVAAILLVMGGVGFFSTFLAPIAFFENVIDDLNDQLASLDIRQERMFKAKVSYDERNKAFKGCTKLSIRCKAKSLSERQVKSFEKKNIKVEYDMKEFAGVKRYFPKSYSFNGGPKLSPSEFVNEMRTNQALRLAFKRAINMRYMGFSDDRFLNWTQKKLGISKRKPVLTGNEDERAAKLATLEDNRVTKDTKFIETKDREGNKAYVIEGGDPELFFSEADVASITRRFGKLGQLAESFTNSKLGGQAIKAVSIVGALDMACSVKNMIGMAASMTKVLAQTDTAVYASKFMAMAYAQKISDISPEDSTALNRNFMDTDPRKTLPDVNASYQQAYKDGTIVEGKNTTEEIASKEAPNPYYGKNVMDSSLYKMSTGSMAVASPTSTSIKYSLGMGRTTLLAAVGATAVIMEDILNLGAGNAGCDIIQNWAVRGVSFVVGIIAIIGSGGSSAAANIAMMVVLAAAFMAANAALMSVLSDDIVPDDIKDRPDDKAALLWTGVSGITATTSQARGMMPANASEITEYRNLTNASVNDYAAIEREDSSFFDYKNPYSPSGRTLMALQEYTPDSYTATGVLSSLTSLQHAALSKPFSDTALAASATDRFKKCDDSSYAEVGIDADVQCNVRYIMRDADLARDPEVVMDYMESNGYVELDAETGDSITGMPEGYTPPDPQATSNFMKDIASGVVNSFFNTRSYGSTSAGQEYGKFLDYCVYRAMPYGNTYEEAGAIGSVDRKWLTGEKCRSNDEQISMFRIYTMDVTLDDTITENAPTTNEVPAVDDGTGLVNGSDQDLAKQILASGKVTADSRYLGQIQAYAKGDYSCNINHDILRLIASIAQKHTIYISSLNRRCTGVTAGSSTTSPHYAQAGGHAVDIAIVDGVAATGSTANEVALIKEFAPKMPKNSEVGQVQCRAAKGINIKLPDYIIQFNDGCNHTHLNVPFPN